MSQTAAMWMTSFLTPQQRAFYHRATALGLRAIKGSKIVQTIARENGMSPVRVQQVLSSAQKNLSTFETLKSKGSTATVQDYKVKHAEELMAVGLSSIPDVERLYAQGTLSGFLKKNSLEGSHGSLIAALSLYRRLNNKLNQ